MRQEETERRLVFDINDFDETLPGPWEWDLKRLITSIEICGRHRGFSVDDRKDTILAAARMYREMMLRFSDTGNMSMWYEHIDLERMYRIHEEELGKKRQEKSRIVPPKLFQKTMRVPSLS